MNDEMSVDFRGKKYNPLMYKFRDILDRGYQEEDEGILTKDIFDLFSKFYELVKEVTNVKKSHMSVLNDGDTENILAMNLFWIYMHPVLGELEFVGIQNNKFNSCGCGDADCVWEDHSRYIILITRNKEDMFMYDNRDDILFISDEFVSKRFKAIQNKLCDSPGIRSKNVYPGGIIVNHSSKAIN